MNVVFMGVFFILPLYLQIVLGLDALDTGLRLLPMSWSCSSCRSAAVHF